MNRKTGPFQKVTDSGARVRGVYCNRMPGVYIAYPFCAQKCTFCNFASGVFPRDLEARYVAALLAEMRAHAWAWTPDTLYLGGGTPSLLSSEALAALLGAVPGRPWAEATIEAAPGSITAERAAAWCESGINRVSLGAQSFVAAELSRTGRRHTPETVAHEMEILRRAGMARFNIDLIAGLPRQTMEGWRESLAWVKRLDAGHVSVYMLEVDDDSRLGHEIRRHGTRYSAADVPDEDQTAAFYETAIEELERAGLQQYEISNFARPGDESLHNLKYWTLAPYVGFGADAHSFDGAVRRANAESPAEYAERMERDGVATVETTAAHLVEEKFMVGLRLTKGVRPSEEEWERFRAPIERFVEAGLLEINAGVLRLTQRGVLLSNEVLQEFLCQ
jgi:oxygen-independent coproporphyrinogen III oxidase